MGVLKWIRFGFLVLPLLPLQTVAQSTEFQQGKAAYDNHHYQEAFDLWLPLAKGGDVHAQFQLATLFDEGLIEGKNNQADAFKWYELAALQGHPVASYNLGNAYKHGRGTIQSEDLASYWWQKASDANIASAQFNLALQYHRGLGVPKDPQQTVELINRAAHNGHQKAADLLATGQVPTIAIDTADNNKPSQEPLQESVVQADQPQAISATEWLMEQNPDNFCIQLGVLSSDENVQRFIGQYGLANDVNVPVIVRGEQSLHYVLMGQFATRDLAVATLKKLPMKVRQLQPWPRTFGQLQTLSEQQKQVKSGSGR